MFSLIMKSPFGTLHINVWSPVQEMGCIIIEIVTEVSVCLYNVFPSPYHLLRPSQKVSKYYLKYNLLSSI